MKVPEKLFISGTDTGIGKTIVSSMIVAGLQASYWKPVQAGIEEETDSEFVSRTNEISNHRIIPERYKLKTPMSPHGAADIDGVEISLNDFAIPEFHTSHLIVEGAGGLIVPLNWKHTVLDLIKQFDIPVLLVARSSLGTLNHTLLSVEALQKRDIPIFGIVVNGNEHRHNVNTLKHFTGLPVWETPILEHLNKESLKYQFSKTFEDWEF